MTIQVNIRNDDTRKGAVIRVHGHAAGKTETTGYEDVELDAGAEVAVGVHEGKEITISELRQP